MSIFSLLDLIGTNILFRYANRSKLTVPCYHGITRQRAPGEDYCYRNSVSVDAFREQLKRILSLYKPLSLSEVATCWEREKKFPANALLVTFDDGFKNNLLTAAPILKELSIPAVFFVSTNYIGKEEILWPQRLDEMVLSWRKNSIPIPSQSHELQLPSDRSQRVICAEKIRKLCKRLPEASRKGYLNMVGEIHGSFCLKPWQEEIYEFMNWQDVRKLADLGFEIGAHTVSHPILTQISEEQLRFELKESKKSIERKIGLDCMSMSYPNGGPNDVNERIFDIAKECGYEFGFTLGSPPTARSANPLSVGRARIDGNEPMSLFTSRASGLRPCISRLQELFASQD